MCRLLSRLVLCGVWGCLCLSPNHVCLAQAKKAEGRPVLVNYTAAWCVSCRVNDRVALSTNAVSDALKRNNAVYLKADWTKRDASIAAELARFGRAGVPLYLVYGAKGGEPAILPSILTEGVVVKALDAAGKASDFLQVDEAEVHALAVDAKGAIYAGTGPGGRAGVGSMAMRALRVQRVASKVSPTFTLSPSRTEIVASSGR